MREDRGHRQPPSGKLCSLARGDDRSLAQPTGLTTERFCVIARRQYVPERPRHGDETPILTDATPSSAGSCSAPRDARDAQGRTRHGFRERTVWSRVIARQIYGITYDRNESDQKRRHL